MRKIFFKIVIKMLEKRLKYGKTTLEEGNMLLSLNKNIEFFLK